MQAGSAIFISLIMTICFVNNSFAGKPYPAWYSAPTQNSKIYLYGVAEGRTLEEATKYSLAELSSRLITKISSESNLIREENNSSTNEEMRQKVSQMVESIDFSGFETSHSAEIDGKFYVEVRINKENFIQDQKERIFSLEQKISSLNEKMSNKNLVTRKIALLKILSALKEIELKSRIIAGSGEKLEITSTLNRINEVQANLDKLSDNFEFYVDMPIMSSESESSNVKIANSLKKTIENALSNEKIKISQIASSKKNQVQIRVLYSAIGEKIYGSFVTKLNINFQCNSGDEKATISSNSIEASGSSAISEKQAFEAAIFDLKEKFTEQGSFKILGLN